MKKLLLILVFITPALFAFSQSPTKIKISWEFVGVVEGYDHNTKCKVWIDSELAGQSTVTKETKKNKMTVKTTTGTHHVRILNFADYDGHWEEHTIENEYSLDALYDSELELSKKNKIHLVFNIEAEETTPTVSIK